MKLYHYPQTRAQSSRWILEEIGLAYELVHVDLANGEQKSPAFLKINPMGGVPAISCDKYTMFEGVAIVLKLADQYPEKELAPHPTSPERAAYLQWCLFGIANLDNHLEYITEHTQILPDGERLPAVVEAATENIAAPASCLNNHLNHNQYMLADKFSAADILTCHYADWMAYLGLLADYPDLSAYRDRLVRREAYQRSIAVETE